MRSTRPQVNPLLRAHAPAPLKFLHHHRAFEDKLLSRFVSKGDGPAPELIKARQRLDQVTIEGVAPHLSIGDDVDASILLEGDGLVHRTVFYGLELRRVDLPCCQLLASFC